MTIAYVICLIAAVGLSVAYLLMVKPKELWLTMLYISIAVVNLGYLMMSFAKTVGFAVFSNDVAYLGSVFLSMFMLLTIVRLCGFEIKKAYVITCVALGTVMFAIIASSPMLSLYYKSVDIKMIDGAAKLVKEYGILHPVYMVYLLGYFAAMIGTIIHSVRKKKIGRPKLAGFIAAIVCSNLAVWLLEKLVSWEYEFLSVTYIASELLLLLVYWMMQDYIHKRDVPPIVENKRSGQERLLALSLEKGLTGKEREVLDCMLAGVSRKEVAVRLHVSENTVKTHIKHIYEKLNVSSREEVFALIQE